MNYELPTSVTVGGKEYDIRSDYRPMLDLCAALADPELDRNGQAEAALTIFYPDRDILPLENQGEALAECLRFLNGGEALDGEPSGPRLVDWEQDFPLIVAPVNRVLGREIRSLDYLHWWSFLAAYQEIGGNCAFAQVVTIRDKQARHKKLDKTEQDWLRRNRKLVVLKKRYTQADNDLIKQWT